MWHELHLKLLNELRKSEQLDFSRFSMDGASAQPRRGPHTGPNPTDRGKLGSKRHIVTDAQGIPVMFCVTEANRHDSVVFPEELVDALPGSWPAGQAIPWPESTCGQGCDYPDAVAPRHRYQDRIARKGIERNDRLGRHRWVVERTHAWLAAFGKLRTRFERRIDIHVALLSLACCVICLRSLTTFC